MSKVRNASYWDETAPVEVGQPLAGSVSCDVCVIGAGYTGLWTAHFIKAAEPALDVQIVEAEHAGAGASGLNSGFVTLMAGKVLRRLVWYYGPGRTAAAYRAQARSIVEIGRFCRKHGIDAEFEPNGMLQVATDQKQLTRLELQTKRAERAGLRHAFTLLDGPQARELVDSPVILGALRTAGALLNPRKLVLGLARVVRAAGIPIHERTPALRIARDGDRWVVTTPAGRVTAAKVVVATNAYQHQFPQLARKALPMWSYVLVTEPLPGHRLDQVGWKGREGIGDLRSFATAARLTADNRVVWSGGPVHYFRGRDMDPSHASNESAHRALRAEFDGFFPMWRDVPHTHAYGGCIAWTRNFVPNYGEVEPGLFYGHGDLGNGVAASHTGGKVLRDLVLGRDTDYVRLLFVTVRQPAFLPEPLATAGARLFVWRQDVGDRLPVLSPWLAARTGDALLSTVALIRERRRR